MIVAAPLSVYTRQDVPKLTDLVGGSKGEEAAGQVEEAASDSEITDPEQTKPLEDIPGLTNNGGGDCYIVKIDPNIN